MTDHLPRLDTPCLAIIGNFDGVHLGHQALLAEARQEADKHGLPLIALTFTPHPRAHFTPADAPAEITPAPLKTSLLLEAGADLVVTLPFDARLAGLSAADFIFYLKRDLRVERLVVSPYIRFGQKQAGNAAMLEEAWPGAVTQVSLVEMDGPISSTCIRAAIVAGDMKAAAKLLGRPHLIYRDGPRWAGMRPKAGIYPVQAYSEGKWTASSLEISGIGAISASHGQIFAFWEGEMPELALNPAFLAANIAL